LTEIYLCASCSCHEILRSTTARVSRWDHPRQVPSALRMARYAADASYPAAPATHDRVIEAPWVPQPLAVAGEQRAQRFNRNCFAHRRSPPPPHRSVRVVFGLRKLMPCTPYTDRYTSKNRIVHVFMVQRLHRCVLSWDIGSGSDWTVVDFL
jgi:hypothetical protein